jgi:RNA polymerase sigma-70 factor (ECF subfamily)
MSGVSMADSWEPKERAGTTVPVSAEWPLDRDSVLRQMVEHHFDFVWRLLRRLGVSAADADDAAQQVFIVVSGRLHGLDTNRVREFLFGVAWRVAANARRARQRRREVNDDSLERIEHPSLDPEEALDRQKGLDLLDAILQAMPQELSLVLILTEIEEMSKSEVAAFLGIPEGTVASRLKSARERFRSALQRSIFVRSAKVGVP